MPPIEDDSGAEVPEWVVTFGDMMSLLLTFFIMLFSMSEVKEEKRYQAYLESLRKRFGHESAILSLVPGQSSPRNSALAKMTSMGRSRRQDTLKGGARVKAPTGENALRQKMDKGQLATRGGLLAFEEGSAELTPAHRRQLEEIAKVIGGKPQMIEIRGHTSSRPLPDDSPFEDHRQLALKRCCVVEDYLVKLGVEAERIRLWAAADREPLYTDTDPLLRKENSRVEVVMLNQYAEKPQHAPAEPPEG
jgi:chemotaxis protein MotB